jgi:hypothetical protein
MTYALFYFLSFEWRAPAVLVHILIIQAPDCRLQKKKVNLFLLLIWDVYVCVAFFLSFLFLYEWKSNYHHRLFDCLCASTNPSIHDNSNKCTSEKGRLIAISLSLSCFSIFVNCNIYELKSLLLMVPFYIVYLCCIFLFDQIIVIKF